MLLNILHKKSFLYLYFRQRIGLIESSVSFLLFVTRKDNVGELKKRWISLSTIKKL